MFQLNWVDNIYSCRQEADCCRGGGQWLLRLPLHLPGPVRAAPEAWTLVHIPVRVRGVRQGLPRHGGAQQQPRPVQAWHNEDPAREVPVVTQKQRGEVKIFNCFVKIFILQPKKSLDFAINYLDKLASLKVEKPHKAWEAGSHALTCALWSVYSQ